LPRLLTWEWVLIAVSLVLVERYFWLMDDAFIDFRYVDNALFLGRGLVFNQGEYVEGFSSPAWVMLLLGLRWLGFDYFAIVHGVALIAAALYGACAIAVNRRFAPPGAPPVNLALAIAAAHYGILSNFSSGLETPLVQACAGAYALLALAPESRALQVLVGLSPLVRPELALPALFCAAWHVTWLRRVPWALLGALSIGNGAWLIFRIVYYADLLPNTYYLKATVAWKQGRDYLRNALDPHFMRELAPLLALAWLAIRKTLPAAGRARLLILLCAGSVATWVARLGGDMLYFRFMAFPVCLGLLASGGIAEGWLLRLPWPRLRPVFSASLACLLCGFSFACYPPQLLGHPLTSPRTRHWHGIAEVMWHRNNASLAPPSDAAASDRMRRERYAQATALQRAPRAVFVTGWCKDAYDAFDRFVMQDYGLTDAVLARLDAPWGRPGHRLVQNEAAQLAQIYRRYGSFRGDGMFRRAARDRHAPRWVQQHLDVLDIIERKVSNHHTWRENLSLATTKVARIPIE
jgi:hypothetical protein